MQLTVENISKSYGKQKALNRFSISMTEGIYGLIGPNGSGKSTLMQILTQNLPCDEGEICWNGKKISQCGMDYLSVIGYMPQDSVLYPQLTVSEFLGYMATVKGIDKKTAKEQIPEILEATSLTEASGKRISALSGGMRQRTCLAQALLGDPKILILDEPTAGLDPAQRVAVRSMLARMSMDRIILLATHVVGDVEGIAKELFLISQGNLLEHVTPGTLLERMRGHVFTLAVDESNYAQVAMQHRVVSLNTAGGKMSLRILSDTPPEGAICAEPTLEDAYLALYGQEINSADSSQC